MFANFSYVTFFVFTWPFLPCLLIQAHMCLFWIRNEIALLVCLHAKLMGSFSPFFPFSTFLYLKFLVVWALVLVADFVLEFRFEYLWPFWLFIRSVYDSFRYQGLVCIKIEKLLICCLLLLLALALVALQCISQLKSCLIYIALKKLFAKKGGVLVSIFSCRTSPSATLGVALIGPLDVQKQRLSKGRGTLRGKGLLV